MSELDSGDRDDLRKDQFAYEDSNVRQPVA